MNEETKTTNGKIWSRYLGDWNNNPIYHHWRATEEKTLPAIMCECENTTFELVYGTYELFAVCSKCGKKDLVYDG